jgi:hypothetical protein
MSGQDEAKKIDRPHRYFTSPVLYFPGSSLDLAIAPATK